MFNQRLSVGILPMSFLLFSLLSAHAWSQTRVVWINQPVSARPVRYVGTCPARIRLTARLALYRPGVLFYHLQSNLRVSGPVFHLPFTTAVPRSVASIWVLPRSGNYWARIAMTSPVIAFSNYVHVQVVCR